jgi:hypothetical protein
MAEGSHCRPLRCLKWIRLSHHIAYYSVPGQQRLPRYQARPAWQCAQRRALPSAAAAVAPGMTPPLSPCPAAEQWQWTVVYWHDARLEQETKPLTCTAASTNIMQLRGFRLPVWTLYWANFRPHDRAVIMHCTAQGWSGPTADAAARRATTPCASLLASCSAAAPFAAP